MWTVFIIVLLPSGVHGGEFAFFPVFRLFGLVSFIAWKTAIKAKEDMEVFLDLKYYKLYKYCTLFGTWESHCLGLILGL